MPALFVIGIIKFCPESCLWLESKGRFEEADAICDVWEEHAIKHLHPHELPYKVRLEERKSLRVWLSAGEKDLDIVFGDWLLANRVMAAALEYRDYDYQFHVTVGAHNLRYASATMPETLRWLWR